MYSSVVMEELLSPYQREYINSVALGTRLNGNFKSSMCKLINSNSIEGLVNFASQMDDDTNRGYVERYCKTKDRLRQKLEKKQQILAH